MCKQILLFILLSSISSFSCAQKKSDRIPLLFYLQAHFDTTIVLHEYTAWVHRPNYRIICKKNGKTQLFTYRHPITSFNGTIIPKELSTKYITNMIQFGNSLPDTNQYFLPLPPISYSKNESLSHSFDSLQLWQIAVHDIYRSSCPGNVFEIYDSSEYNCWLITKEEIHKLYFYDPSFYEECCPGNKDRQTFLKFLQLMNTYFP